MQRITKRVLSFLLAAVMVLSVLPWQAFAAESGDAVPEETVERGGTAEIEVPQDKEIVEIRERMRSISDTLTLATAEEEVQTVSDAPAPQADEPCVEDYETFLFYLYNLEELARIYIEEMGLDKDPLALVIKYIRTGVDRYNSGSWGIMAGYEDAEFASFVKMMEDALNETAPSEEDKVYISALKNIELFYAPNGDYVDFGHMFGTMDITYHNNGSQNHADVAGWAGDLVDLLSTTDRHYVSGELEDMVADISENYLCHDFPGESDLFTLKDMYGDLDAYYVMQQLSAVEYEAGVLYMILSEYFTPELTDEARADFFLKNRLDGVGTRAALREAVYNAYTGNKVISTLEATREFETTDLINLRKACCYSFADYLCRLAGDYVEVTGNPYFSVFSSEFSTLAPGITQEIKYATSADNKQMVYYIATADLNREDVHVFANYNENDPGAGWAMSRVQDQVAYAQEKYGNPESEYYIPNYTVVASTNGAGYNMETGEPGGLLVMGGVEYHPVDDRGFFGILKDGTAVIGTKEEYNTIYKGQVQEAVSGFGATLIKDGKIVVSERENYFDDRASRTAVGITKTGKVVLMVLDGRQEPFSCGGSMEEIAQIMLEAGCVEAINLDGGGSTTYVAKQEGAEQATVVNKPSDGVARSVSASLMMVSTAPSSTAFDHAIIESDFSYMTVNSTVQLSAKGVSATGNSATIPEGTTWAVSDNRWGTVSEDGTFTAQRVGDVEVYLMLGEEIIGSKTLHIGYAEKVYYTRKNLDLVYGASAELPIKVLIGGKAAAFNADDVTFELGNEAAGYIDGLSFFASETTTLKNVQIIVKLASDEFINDTLTVSLYNQGEMSFDFDKATGGDRQLAFDRQVSNSTTEDSMTYFVESTDDPMVTSYIFAIDMTKIPIPEQLSELIYMLPGADVEGASAWGFLLNLAERVSVLSEVKPVLRFDKNFDVDYSELNIINEYFKLNKTEFDEETNTLTLTLNWVDQTQAIDPNMANPLCIVSGIKLTPKEDAEWSAKNRLTAYNEGEISYKVYLRTSSLYSFAQKPENQETFGIYPFVNPDIPSEAGGYFGSVYKEFSDTYTLDCSVKDGWVTVDGGFAYYVNGEMLTGISEAEGYYYDFGENGVCVGQNKYTGIFFDEAAGVYRYSKVGVLTAGWNTINGNWHYFRSSTMAAATGELKMFGIVYEFEEDGKLVSGVWGQDMKGRRYFYGPEYYVKGWEEIDGEMYYFENGYCVTGYRNLRWYENIAHKKWFYFDEAGICHDLEDGLHVFDDGSLYYLIDGVSQMGLHKVDGDYYFFTYAGPAVCGQSYYAWETHCDLPCSTYNFGDDGKMINGLVKTANGTVYYINGKVASNVTGLNKIGDDYYFIASNGKCATGKYYAWATHCDLPCGNYEFGADGKMLQGIVEKEDGHYYYINGKISNKNAGLTKIGEDYYFVASNGRCAVGPYYAWATNCDLPCSNYEFGADGKMLQGIVSTETGTYYYINGKPAGKYAGLTKIDEDYYFVASNGRCAVGSYYAWATNCDLPCGNYEFAADGKMLQGIVEKDDGHYYYVNGRISSKYAGLTKVGEDYYFVAANGRCATGSYYAWATNCDLPCATYEFGADGKMLHGLVEKEDGTYCYVNGQLGGKSAGLHKIGEDYYFVTAGGKCVTGKYYAWASFCDLPCAEYEFAADGKMLNGFVTKADGIYYYENGRLGKVGLNYIDGYYYFVTANGKLVTGCSYYAWETNGLLIEQTYTFDDLGRIVR